MSNAIHRPCLRKPRPALIGFSLDDSLFVARANLRRSSNAMYVFVRPDVRRVTVLRDDTQRHNASNVRPGVMMPVLGIV
jgi:hypothetical protein